MNRRFEICAVAAAMVLAACAPALNGSMPAGPTNPAASETAGRSGANLVSNGSFEKPKVPSGSYTDFNKGQRFQGWTVVGASGDVSIVSDTFVYGGFTFPAGCGHQLLDLTGTTNSATGVQQSVTTVPGTTYQLSFQVGNVYAPSSDLGTSSTVLVYMNGKRILKATNKKGKGLTHIVWQQFSTSFVAKGNAARIKFINGDPPTDTANGLDCISVTAG